MIKNKIQFHNAYFLPLVDVVLFLSATCHCFHLNRTYSHGLMHIICLIIHIHIYIRANENMDKSKRWRINSFSGVRGNYDPFAFPGWFYWLFLWPINLYNRFIETGKWWLPKQNEVIFWKSFKLFLILKNVQNDCCPLGSNCVRKTIDQLIFEFFKTVTYILLLSETLVEI